MLPAHLLIVKVEILSGKIEKTGATSNERRLMMIIVSLKKCVAGTDLSNQNEKECKMERFSDTDDIYNGD